MSQPGAAIRAEHCRVDAKTPCAISGNVQRQLLLGCRLCLRRLLGRLPSCWLRLGSGSGLHGSTPSSSRDDGLGRRTVARPASSFRPAPTPAIIPLPSKRQPTGRPHRCANPQRSGKPGRADRGQGSCRPAAGGRAGRGSGPRTVGGWQKGSAPVEHINQASDLVKKAVFLH